VFIIDHKLPKNLNKIRDVLSLEFEEYLGNNFVNVTRNKKDLIKKSISCFLLNANNSVLKNSKTFGIIIHPEKFSQKVIVNGRDTGRKVSHKYFRSFLDFLVFEDYGLLDKGGEYTGHSIVNGKLVYDKFTSSRFTLNTKFLNLYKDLVKRSDNFELISNVLVLRGSDKENKTFKITHKEKEKVKYLNSYNRFSLTTPVTAGDKKLDIQLYKVANEDFESGMRSFTVGEYQSMSKQERSSVLIGGEPTVCYDFKGFEPSLAYSVNQEIMECDDPYHIEELLELGYEEELCRKLVKKILIICLNTKDKKEAKLAINCMLSEEFNIKKLYEKGKIPEKNIHINTFIEAILDKHYLISDCFFSAKGLSLQAVGAAINDYVLDHLMQNYKILCLQVHDDFRVAQEYENTLPLVMEQAYEHVLGFSDNCKIVKED